MIYAQHIYADTCDMMSYRQAVIHGRSCGAGGCLGQIPSHSCAMFPDAGSLPHVAKRVDLAGRVVGGRSGYN